MDNEKHKFILVDLLTVRYPNIVINKNYVILTRDEEEAPLKWVLWWSIVNKDCVHWAEIIGLETN